MSYTTIQVEDTVVELLKSIKEYPKQSYNEIIKKVFGAYVKNLQKGDQYNKFLHYIQQAKMKELWDNKADEDWDNV